MSYPIYNTLRLPVRDLVFLTKYLLKEKSFQTKTKAKAKAKPLVLCNSYPKSGTHLLYQILYSLPGLKAWDDIVSVQSLCGMMNPPCHIRWKIGSAPNHAIVRSHLMYCDEIREILQEFDCKVIFIYRDLRDVAVSHACWIPKEKRIFLHQYYLELNDFNEQLMRSIKGVPLGTPFGSNLSQPDIGQDFSRWKGWINDPKVLAIKFEDLVGSRGGSSEITRFQTIQKIVNYLEIDLTSQQIATQFASEAMNPQESHTFRKGGKGSIGRWRSLFTEAHKQAFKQVAGDLLIELNYESDHNW